MKKTVRRGKREENARQTKESLVRAALRVVQKHGYAGASVQRITQESGVAQGTLYSYFGSHKALLDELLPRQGIALLDAIADSVADSDGYFDMERRAFDALFVHLRNMPHLLRLLTEAETAAPASFAQHVENIEERYLRALRRARASGEIREQTDGEYRIVAGVLSSARGFIAIGFSRRERHRLFRAPPMPDWAADAYVKFLRHGLGSNGAPSARHRTSFTAQQQEPTDTRTRILEAAAWLIHRDGYAATSVAAICEQAGIGVGTFYGHFPGRQQMFDELLIHGRQELLASLAQATRGSESFLEYECRSFDGFFDFLYRKPWFTRLETEAAVWSPDNYLRYFFDLADRYVDVMREFRERSELAAFEERELLLIACILMASRHHLATRIVLRGQSAVRMPSRVRNCWLTMVARGLAAN